jgi:nucleoid-associated protein YgaU
MASLSSMANMVSAYIQVLPPGVGTVRFQYNPEEYTISKHATWESTPQVGQSDGGTPQYGGNSSNKLDAIKILLDTFALPPNPPQAAIDILKEAMTPTPESVAANAPMPPSVMFGWGSNIILEEAYIKSLQVTYKRFLLGVPVRAELVVDLEEIPISLPGTNPTSGGIASRRTHTVIEGDTLASIAFQEYRNPTKWRALAEANGVDDPLRLAPGTVLLVPEPSEVDALA